MIPIRVQALIAFFAMAILCGQEADAAASSMQKAQKLTTSVKEVSIFKDGTAHIVRQSRMLTKGWHWLKPPEMILGGFWAIGPKADLVDRVVSKKARIPKAHPCASLAKLLLANAGKSVKLYLPKDKTIAGILLPLEGHKPSQTPAYFFVRVGKAVRVIPRNQILRAEFTGTPNAQCRKMKDARQMFFRLRAPAKLRIQYIQKGLQWAPLYRIQLAKKRAQLRMHALVVNNRGDLATDSLKLIAGIPNVINKALTSPLSLTQKARYLSRSYRSWSRRYNRNYTAQRFSNAHSRNITRRTRPLASNTALQFGKGGGIGSLYAYKLGKVNLPKGARLMLPVLRASLPIRRYYLWKPGTAKATRAYHQQRFRNVKQLIRDRVWRYVEIQNTTQAPLTTGPALLTKKDFVMAQDLMRYTPPGGRVQIPLHVAANVLSKQRRIETSRKGSAYRHRRHWYTRVNYKTTLTLVNFTKKPARIRIRKLFSGKVLEAPGAKTHTTGSGNALNPQSEVNYTITLKPKARWTKSYTYFSYVY